MMSRTTLALTAAAVAMSTACPPAPQPRGDGGVPDGGSGESEPSRLTSPHDTVDLDDADDTVHFTLVAGRLPDADTGGHRQYGYNDISPGPTLRAEVGQDVVIDFRNDLDVPTTVHWHGIHVPWAMDGATWTQDPIAPGASFQYAFTVEVAGTFWYHPHFNTDRQVDLGLYGAFIVEDPAEPRPDDELIVFLDAEPETTQDAGVTSPLGHRWTVNGAHRPEYVSGATGVVRLRLINASNGGYVAVEGAALRQIGSDQGLLSVVIESPTTVMAPGDRSDFELLVGASTSMVVSQSYSSAGPGPPGTPETLFDVRAASGESPMSLPWASTLVLPSPAPIGADIVYVLTGDGSTGQWRINGEAYPDVTVRSVELDAVVHILVRNLSSTEHPFHIHGHAFEVVSIDGQPPMQRRMEDTVNVAIQSDVMLRLKASNAGEWMTHCHILSHAEGGMMTVLNVAAESAD